MTDETYPGGSKGRVNKAGENVRNGVHSLEDLLVIDKWRGAHTYILNTFQATLRKRTRNQNIVVAQRIKRKTTIFSKLTREQKMQLSRMDDIAGCRLIFDSIDKLISFRTELHKARFKHKLRNDVDKYDYIDRPKHSGYRGIHDVYEYYNDKSIGGKKHNGLLLEIQYRTSFQHAWATSVEVAGFVTSNQPKFSQGDGLHLDFFRVTSEIIARAYEEKKSCLGDLNDWEVVNRFNEIESKINLLRTLKGINSINRHLSDKKNVILVFSEGGQLDLFTFNDSPSALKKYFTLEKEASGNDIVFVRADSGADIRNAFRNYFSDTGDFVHFVEQGCQKLSA